MNSFFLYINDQLVDVNDGTFIALSYQSIELGELRSRSANFSNIISLPKTETNCKIFQSSDNINSLTTVPYRKLSAKLIQNGIEVISTGTAVLDSSIGDFNITIYSGIFDFFTLLDALLINDLDYSAENTIGAWSKTRADGIRNTTASLIAPIIQYGVNLYKTGGVVHNTYTNGTGIELSLPSFYYHTIIKKIISEAGYNYSGNIFSDTTFLKLIVPVGNSTSPATYTDEFYNARNFRANAVGGQSIVNPGSPTHTQIEFTNVAYNGTKLYYDGTKEYSRDGSETDNFMVQVYVWLDITVTGGTVRLALTKNSTSIQGISSSAGTGVYELSAQITSGTLGTGKLGVGVSTDVNPATCVINGGVFMVKTSGSPFTEFGITWTNDVIQMYSQVLPPLTQKDFMKDFMIRFCLVPKELNGTMYFKGLNEIISDRANAKDWTTKRDPSKDEGLVYFKNGVGQTNYYQYEITDELRTDVTTGRGEILIDNENLPVKTEFTSAFSSSATSGNDVGIFSALVKVWDDTTGTEYDNDPGARLLLVRDKISSEPSVVWDSTARSDYKVAYFDDPRFGSCRFQAFIDSYYSSISAALSKTKIVSRYYILTEADIISYDPYQLIFDDGSYFIINKISNFNPIASTKVELLKVG